MKHLYLIEIIEKCKQSSIYNRWFLGRMNRMLMCG